MNEKTDQIDKLGLLVFQYSKLLNVLNNQSNIINEVISFLTLYNSVRDKEKEQSTLTRRISLNLELTLHFLISELQEVSEKEFDLVIFKEHAKELINKIENKTSGVEGLISDWIESFNPKSNIH